MLKSLIIYFSIITDYLIFNKNQVSKKGSKVALFGLGYSLAEKVAKELGDKYGITATIVNPKFITG